MATADELFDYAKPGPKKVQVMENLVVCMQPYPRGTANMWFENTAGERVPAPNTYKLLSYDGVDRPAVPQEAIGDQFVYSAKDSCELYDDGQFVIGLKPYPVHRIYTDLNSETAASVAKPPAPKPKKRAAPRADKPRKTQKMLGAGSSRGGSGRAAG